MDKEILRLVESNGWYEIQKRKADNIYNESNNNKSHIINFGYNYHGGRNVYERRYKTHYNCNGGERNN